MRICGSDKLPILFNQENFLLHSNKHKVTKAIPDFHVVFKPAIKNNKFEGRPKNGMFIAVPLHLRSNIVDVSPVNYRIQAFILNLDNSQLLLINTYFPCDSRNRLSADPELYELILEIGTIIEDHSFDNIIIGGDINSDFLRSTAHVNIIRDFIEEYNMVKVWDNYDINFTCISERENCTNIPSSSE